MQLFKAFFKIAKKRLLSLSIYFIIYAAITILLGTTSQRNIDANFQSSELDICIIDEDHSEASAALVNYLGSIHNLAELENNPEILQDHLYYRDISYVLTIPEGFEEKLTAGETQNLFTNVKVPGSSAGYFVDQQVSQYTKTLQLYLAGGYSLTDAIDSTDTAISNMEVVNSIIFQEESASERKEVFYFFQYLPYIFIVLLVCGLAPIIITFHEKDTAARIHCSSTTLSSQNFQLSLSCIFYSLFIWIAFFILGALVYGTGMFTANALYATLNSFVFLLIATALSLFASNFAIDYNTVNMIANTVGLGMAFFCGVFVPQNMLSEQVLSVARILPAYWYIRANNMLAGLSTESFDLHFYWTAIGIQLLFAAALFAIMLAVSKMKRQRR